MWRTITSSLAGALDNTPLGVLAPDVDRLMVVEPALRWRLEPFTALAPPTSDEPGTEPGTAHPSRPLLHGRRLLLRGEFDTASCDVVRGLVEHLLACGHDVVVDLAGVTFCDVCAGNCLLGCAHRAAEVGRWLHVENVAPFQRRVLELLGFGDVLRVV